MNKILLLLVLLTLVTACTNKKEEKPNCCAPKQNKLKLDSQSLPDLSVYQLDAFWKNQQGDGLILSSFAGKPVLMTMIYTHCGYACPLMVSDLKKIEQKFTAEERANFHIVLVSFDPDRDSPSHLKAYAESQQLGENWTLLQGSHLQTKELSVVLQISYELFSDSIIDHANSKVLLNKDGEIVYRIEGLSTDPQLVAEQIKALI